jgi:hypothetical protein
MRPVPERIMEIMGKTSLGWLYPLVAFYVIAAIDGPPLVETVTKAE